MDTFLVNIGSGADVEHRAYRTEMIEAENAQEADAIVEARLSVNEWVYKEETCKIQEP